MFRSRWKWWMPLAALAVSVMVGRADAQPYVYVLGQAGDPDVISHRLRVFNAATNTLVSNILLGDTQSTFPEQIAIAPNGALIYVVNGLDDTVSVVSTAPHREVDTLPNSITGLNAHAVAVSPDSQRLYVTGSEFISGKFQGFLTIVDVPSRSKITRIPVGYQSAYGVAVSPDGSRAYVVTGTSANAVAVINLATNSVVTTVPLPGAALGLSVSLSPDGRFAYFPRRANASNTAGYVQVLDTTTNTLVATTTVGIGPWHIGVSPNGATVFAPSVQSGQVHQLNPVTHASEGATAVAGAFAVAFLPDSSRAYVAAGETLVVMDTATRAVIATIPTVVSRTGFTGYSSAIVATPAAATAPGSTPTNFRATSIAGNRLTLAWNAPASGTPTGYLIEGGVTPGQTLGTIATGSTATTFSFDAPSGTFYLRLRALTASGTTGASNEIQVVVNVSHAPSAPSNLLGLANGSDLVLSWKSTLAGGPPTSHILDVSGAATASVQLPISEVFSFSGVPSGTYTFSVRAANSAGTSPASSPVTLTFPSGCPGAPQVPTNFVVSRTGSQLTISWDPPTAGPAASSYLLKVAGAFNMAVPMSARSISGNVPSGTYILSVLAVNPCGSGVETAPQTITVP